MEDGNAGWLMGSGGATAGDRREGGWYARPSMAPKTPPTRSPLNLRGRLSEPGDLALVAVCLAWAGILGAILAHAVFVTNDSLSNYVHVWYVADRLWGGHGIPLKMPVLGHGDALAFPYAFVPWLSAAIVRPVLGDWTVTLWLVLGFAGTASATLWAFPELRRGWWAATVLVNPILVEAPILGQLPFLWATAFLFGAVGCWRRERYAAAAILLGVAQATHAPVLLPIVGVMVLARLPWEPKQRQLVGWYAVSLAIAAPAAAMVLASPVVEDTSRAALVGNLFGTASLRACVVAAPFALAALRKTRLAAFPAALFVVALVINVPMTPIRHNQFGWGALGREPDRSLDSFLHSDRFVEGAMYRVARASDGKYGMYDVMRQGGVLDSEMFPESMARRSFDSAGDYTAFLAQRKVDFVVITSGYDSLYRTNEHQLLEGLIGRREGGTCVEAWARDSAYDVYRVRRGSC